MRLDTSPAKKRRDGTSGDGGLEDFEADFNLMLQNSISFNGPMHEISKRGLRLLTAFDALMASLIGRPIDVASGLG